MKIIYTILFFADMLLLILLAFMLLKWIDNGTNTLRLIFILSAILLSIMSLIFFLRGYLKTPPSGSNS